MTTFSGKNLCMEYFTGTTNSSGDATFTLTDTPVNTTTQFIAHTNTANATCKVQSVSGKSVTVRFYKFQYDKMASTATSADNLPAGVSSASSVASSSTANGGLVITGTPYWYSTPGGHAHQVKKQYVHVHNIVTSTTTDTTQGIFNTLPVEIILVYSAIL